MKDSMKYKIECFCHDYIENHCPELSYLEASIVDTTAIICESYAAKGKLLVCGNGGSAADAEHIVGELLKSFNLSRNMLEEQKQAFIVAYGEDGAYMATKLQASLPAISLVSHAALISAYNNDVESDLVYAQQVWGYGETQDVLLGISTSGNAENVVYAMKTAKIKDMKVVLLGGRDGGKAAHYADVSIVVKKDKTYAIQEDHIKIYHLICACVEHFFFAG